MNQAVWVRRHFSFSKHNYSWH